MGNASAELSAEDADRFRAFERQRHDNLAASYHVFFSPVTALAIAPLLKAAAVAPAIQLLDVATGPCSLAGAASQAGARTSGVDLSPGMIELAKKTYPGIDFRASDVEHLPFGDRTFDAVLCNFGIGHFPYAEPAVAECVRALKRGGRLAFSWWADPSRQRIQGLFREAITEVGVAPPPDVPKGYSILRFSDSGEFRRLLEGGGLVDVTVEDHETTFTMPDAEALWQTGLGSFVVTTAAIAHQNPATQDAIHAALVRRAAAYQTPDGLKLPVAFKIASGRKPD